MSRSLITGMGYADGAGYGYTPVQSITELLDVISARGSGVFVTVSFSEGETPALLVATDSDGTVFLRSGNPPHSVLFRLIEENGALMLEQT